MQNSRLFEMIYLLMEKNRITAAELAERFEVSTRTIYRDIDLLSGSGIPVYCNKGKGGGISLLPDFVLNKSLLTEREQNEILFALQSLKATNAVENDAVLSRLSGMFRRQSVDWIDVDFSRWGSGKEEREKFGILKTGILENRSVSFTYYSSYGVKTDRQADPYKLRFKNSSWYLQAYCPEKQEYRTFKISRMICVKLEDSHFERHEEELPELEPDAKNGGWNGMSLKLELLIAPEMAFRVCDEFDSRTIKRNEDGSITVFMCCPEDNWIYGYLLSFGSALKVISPEAVKEKMKEITKNIIDYYL